MISLETLLQISIIGTIIYYTIIYIARIYDVNLAIKYLDEYKEDICNAQDIEACKECKLLICPFGVIEDEVY